MGEGVPQLYRRRGSAWVMALSVLAISAGAGARLAPSDGPEPPRDRSPALILREARKALESDEGERAEPMLAQLAARHPIIADHAELLRGRWLFQAGRLEDAEAVLLGALQAHADSPLRLEFFQLLGDARAAAGDEAEARDAWRSALDASRRDESRAILLLQIAESFEHSRLPDDAAASYLDLWIRVPVSEASATASGRLDALAVQLGRSLRSATDWRRRADKLFRRRRNEEALAAYDRAMEMGLSEAETRRAQRQRAHTLFRLRRYPLAEEAFGSLPQDNEVRLWHARSAARAGDVPRSVKEFEALAERSRGELSVRARYLAALLLDGRGRDEEARVHFERVAASRATSLAQAALWRLGWSAYRNKQWSVAFDLFERINAAGGDPIGLLRTRYWAARALEQQASPEAEARFAEIAREYPFSYYGWRAQQRVPLEAEPRPVVEVAAGRSRLAPGEFERPRILIEAGFTAQAEDELRGLARRARGLADRLELAQLFSEAGAFHDAQRTVVEAYTETLARGPVARLEELWWHAWPAAYSEFVDASVAQHSGVARALVFSIMREESGYRPAVVSPVGARGLLQIMAETGERLALRVGRTSFDADDLFEPRINIELGAYYLGDLGRRFPGRLEASIASYNAGPNAVSQWVEREGSREDDEWVEAIPYDQTRSYVKRVLRSLQVYRVLY